MLFGLRSFHLIRGELQPAFDLAQQLVRLAESMQDSGLLVEAHLAQGNSLFLFGKLISALEHFERRLAYTTLRNITFMRLSMGWIPKCFASAGQRGSWRFSAI